MNSEIPPIERAGLERLYRRYNKREFVHPDPVEFLYSYPDVRDREIVGLMASSLAYGRVAQIFSSVQRVLQRMPSPRKFLERSSRKSLARTFSVFRHRFTTGRELAALLYGAKIVIAQYGSLRHCFLAGMSPHDDTVLPALTLFVHRLVEDSLPGSLLPSPCRGSACKRLNLFLRWMIREDEVDPGGWGAAHAARLIIPLDTHMHRICRGLGFTRRGQADLRTAREVTDAFRRIVPEDPVRYDFTLTRLGMMGSTAWRCLEQEHSVAV
ncbi:MAG: TIGR02757 family protein [Candidatus Aureabacteria bacterium]|nr:TIGR02757 family protein [Candidatus Auribacterota bacterium]